MGRLEALTAQLATLNPVANQYLPISKPFHHRWAIVGATNTF